MTDRISQDVIPAEAGIHDTEPQRFGCGDVNRVTRGADCEGISAEK
jgi:hypothetical protein